MKLNWKKIWEDYHKWQESGRYQPSYASQRKQIEELVAKQLKATKPGVEK